MVACFLVFLFPGIRLVLLAVALGVSYCTWAQDIRFNTDVLDIKDLNNIDLSQFSQRGYILPGTYTMHLRLNNQELPEQSVAFYPPDDDPKGSEACLTPAIIAQLGFRSGVEKRFRSWHQGECLDIRTLDGVKVQSDLGTSALTLSIPQAYLEYSSQDWDPPSRWDEGIPGGLFDYSLNAQTTRQQRSGSQRYNLSGNGTAGANLGSWRLRAEWQGRNDHQAGESIGRSWDWSRYYAYRAIPDFRSKLVLGEDYLTSDIFDSFRFAGISLRSDDNMLPPNLRGYAPEVSGVAKTNATVTISQQGRVLYETQVAAGPFRIRDLSSAVSGLLDVKVEEQDGGVQTFQVDTASIPYLTRPGQVRYKLATGKPSDWQHNLDGPAFGLGEFSWGVSNGWSLYGGGLAGGQYNALSLGGGRDLLVLGAISFDVTQSRAHLPHDETRTGTSYRANFSRRFNEYDSQMTFAGYRFSDRNFMTMTEYLNARRENNGQGNSKEMYTISLNKQFRETGVTAYLNYFHQTYWNRSDSDRYNLVLSRYFDVGRFKNISASLTAYHTEYNNANDDGLYLSLSLPWGEASTVSYNSNFTRDNSTQGMTYYDRINERGSYSVTAGSSRNGAEGSVYYSHQGNQAQVNASASYQNGRYSALGVNMSGGATVTPEGGALHRGGIMGGTRLLLDTGGVPDIPVRGYGPAINSNAFGKAVVVDVNHYYRNSASVDLDRLSDKVEATRSVVQATLTEGAIGYRRFEVISGEKAMVVLRLADGSHPPFGATVLNGKRQETGIVNDEGSVYLSGINAGERMIVRWDGAERCGVTLPASQSLSALVLTCTPIAGEPALTQTAAMGAPVAVLNYATGMGNQAQ